ncbi:hypothetical protein BS17DRAFT_715144, partial [Gyrodon lividus]
PCNAGIIHCFKAPYCCSFYSHALDCDAVGEHEIYKIDLLNAMSMAKKARNEITPKTIQHCWNHTQIQLDLSAIPSLLPYPVHTDPLTWKIIRDFATSSTMTLPHAEAALQAHLGAWFEDSDWRPALKAIMDAEGAIEDALAAVKSRFNPGISG